MGKSVRHNHQKNVRRYTDRSKLPELHPHGVRRKGQPKRSERKWWTKGYSGDYYPPDEYFENLEKMKENRRNNK